MNSLTTAKGGVQRGVYPSGAPQGYGDPYAGYGQAPAAAGDRPMTVDDVVAKTGMTLGVIVAFAVLNFGIAVFVSMGLALILTAVGAIGGLITVLVATFGKKYGSAAVTLIYAAFEGLFVGGISLLFTGMTVGGSDGFVLIGQAIIGTVGVFLGMLFVYKTGAVKVTPKFNRIMTGALVGVLVLALGNLLLAPFGCHGLTLAAITAAVVGVIFNLALWFALHVIFDEVGRIEASIISMAWPVWGTLNWSALALTVLAAISLFFLHWGVLRTLALSACAGLLLQLLV